VRLTKAQLERIAEDVAERTLEGLEAKDVGPWTDDQYDEAMGYLVPALENVLDSTYPNHIPSVDEL
jgi:hypothetical protein